MKVKIGIVGCGLIAQIHAAAIQSLKNMELIGVCDVNLQIANAFATSHSCRVYPDFLSMLSDPAVDAISLCVPPSLHLPLTKQAAAAHKHVIVEKPLTLTPAAAHEMIETCRNEGVLLCGILQHRFDPLIRTLKDLWQSGIFGPLYLADVRVLWFRDDCYYEQASWRKMLENGGVMLNQAIHYLDLIQYLAGDISTVNGTCRTLGHAIEPEDCVTATFEFESGAIGTLEAATVCYPGLFAEINLFARDGYISMRNDQLISYASKDGTIAQLEPYLHKKKTLNASARPECLNTSSHALELSNFADAIIGAAPLMVSGEESSRVLSLISAILKSSDEGTRICL